MAELAQAYIHLKPYSASEKEIGSLGRYALRVAEGKAAEIYGGGVVVEVELEEGSLITRVTVVGSLILAATGHIADYKGFKESIVEMCDDAREFAVDVCAPFVTKAGLSKDEVYRFERRLKTPGKLYKLSKRLERLEGAAVDLSPREVQKELARLRSDLQVIAGDLSEQELKAIGKTLETKHLPPPDKWPLNEGPPKHAVRDSNEQPLLFQDEVSDEDHPRKRRTVFKSRIEVARNVKRRKRRPSQSAYLPTMKE